jgi:hypothetical protein
VTDRTRNRPPADDADAKAREAAFEAWQPGSAPAAEPEEEIFVPPRAKMSFPPSFLLILAGACVLFALEPTADLRYELFGDAQAIDLGQPAAYVMDAAKDGAHARIKGYLSSIRGTFERWGNAYEVGNLKGIPVLVRRAKHPPAPADTVEVFEGEGRLIRLQESQSSFFERMIDPSSRYNTVRLQFESLGELPMGRQSWLFLEGELPRAHPWRIAQPFLLWGLAVVFSFLAWRSHQVRSAEAAQRRRI